MSTTRFDEALAIYIQAKVNANSASAIFGKYSSKMDDSNPVHVNARLESSIAQEKKYAAFDALTDAKAAVKDDPNATSRERRRAEKRYQDATRTPPPELI